VFDWRDFLSLAESLGAGAQGTTTTITIDEAAYRSTVSRAYYAAFCHARADAVQHLGFRPSNTPSDHGRLADHFLRRGFPWIWRYLDNLRDRRNMCDYDDIVPDLDSEVRDALAEAAYVVGQL